MFILLVKRLLPEPLCEIAIHKTLSGIPISYRSSLKISACGANTRVMIDPSCSHVRGNILN